MPWRVPTLRTQQRHNFFINVADNDFLDHSKTTNAGWGYCVFGEVIAGMDIIKQIEKVRTARVAGHEDVPFEPIIVEKVTIKSE